VPELGNICRANQTTLKRHFSFSRACWLALYHQLYSGMEPTFSCNQFHSFNPLMQLPFADSPRNADRTLPSSERLVNGFSRNVVSPVLNLSFLFMC
jgi:hypothetical protein